VSGSAQHWLEALRGLTLPRPIKILNVCGGHERSIALAGVRSILPGNIELIPGPGCPVCICPEEDIYEAIQMARFDGVTLVAYGDMLRVPVNAPRREPRSLEQAREASGISRCGIRNDQRARRGDARGRRARQPVRVAVGPAHLAYCRAAVG
jgi:hydrogenase expression/formation protein HypD